MANDNKTPETPNPNALGGNGNNRKNIFRPSYNWLFLAAFIGLLAYTYFSSNNSSVKEVSYTQFEKYIEANQLDSVVITTNQKVMRANVKKDAIYQVFEKSEIPAGQKGKVETKISSSEEATVMLKEKGYKGDVKYIEEDNILLGLLTTLGPIALLIFFFFYLMPKMAGGAAGGMNPFSMGKSRAQLFDKNSPGTKITFKDVAGLTEAKQEIEEIVAFLKNPGKYTELGGKIPRGALLVGPPGTGKTLLAKAVAGEASVPFFSMSGADFSEMFVGVGASRVRDLFRQAKEKAPCIIFIDEIDAVGRARGKNFGNVDTDRENTLNQLLTEMDGFGSNSGVIILAATNRANVLDKALLRPGRFDRQIHVNLPEVHDRKEIFLVHLRPLKLADDLDIDFLAKQTPGFSGADIANVCNEAALIAARKNKSNVDKQDFLDAVDRIVGGLEKKTKIITTEEKRAIAFHEAGHATISWMLQYAAPLVKVTIVPRGEALGAAWYLPEERAITNKEHMLDEMCATLGGRAAEEVFFGTMGTGAISDLEKVTKQSYAMVAYFGMSDKIANISFYDSSGQSEYNFSKPYSEKTAELIDNEVKEIIAIQYARAKKILTEHAEQHHKLAEQLIEKEVIFADDLEAIFGKRPWTSRADQLLKDNAEVKEATEISEIETEESDVETDLSEKEQLKIR